VYHSALELAENDRPAFLEKACAGMRACAEKWNLSLRIKSKLGASLNRLLWLWQLRGRRRIMLIPGQGDRWVPTRFCPFWVRVGWEKCIWPETPGWIAPSP